MLKYELKEKIFVAILTDTWHRVIFKLRMQPVPLNWVKSKPNRLASFMF